MRLYTVYESTLRNVTRRAKKMIRIPEFLRTSMLVACVQAVIASGCAHVASRPPGKTLLTYSGPAATVCVSGTMNGWATDQDCMKRKKGRWEVLLALPPGRHAYVLVVDGIARPDPNALLQEEDGFGAVNSILVTP